MRRWLIGCAVMGILSSGWVKADPPNSTIGPGFGTPITDSALATWLKRYLPESTQRLLIFTQCFGGGFLDNFAAEANTTGCAGTDPSSKGSYTGYDAGVADQLKPEAGNNGEKVHDKGTQTKKGEEKPTSTDSNDKNLKLKDFSLEPTSTDGPIRSRHIFVYAGLPNETDRAERDKIKDNFKDQVGTKVTTAGGGGAAGGWNTGAGYTAVQKALKGIGAEIKNSPDPSNEQFILVVLDHGDVDKQEDDATGTGVQPGESKSHSFKLFDSVPGPTGSPDMIPATLLDDPDNRPGFSCFIPFSSADGISHVYDEENYVPFFAPGSWRLTVGSHVLTQFREEPRDAFIELADNVLGDGPGDGVELQFDMTESDFLTLFDGTATLTITNMLQPGDPRYRAYMVTEFAQYSGAIAKDVPEPSGALGLLLAGLLLARPRVRGTF